MKYELFHCREGKRRSLGTVNVGKYIIRGLLDGLAISLGYRVHDSSKPNRLFKALPGNDIKYDHRTYVEFKPLNGEDV